MTTQSNTRAKVRVLCIFGTRPEAIKMAPVIKKLNEYSGIEAKVCVSGQQRQMLDQVLRAFHIIPDYDLDSMSAGQSLAETTSKIMCGVEAVLLMEKPDIVLVHGDTATTLAASLAAYYQKIPVGHIEAGLRTRNIYAPWPEEINRKLVTSIALYHFAPTETAKSNLLSEGVATDQICVTGNTVIDALQVIANRLDSDSGLAQQLTQQFDFIDDTRKLILVTGHRRENLGAGIEAICQALTRLAQRDDVEIVYPVHLNPAVQHTVSRMLQNIPRIHLTPPLDYVPFVYLMKRCYLILTDSGGIQEEAPALGKPVLVMRDVTERPEAINAGTARLVGTHPARIVTETERLLDDTTAYESLSHACNPFGDGKASERIVRRLMA